MPACSRVSRRSRPLRARRRTRVARPCRRRTRRLTRVCRSSAMRSLAKDEGGAPSRNRLRHHRIGARASRRRCRRRALPASPAEEMSERPWQHGSTRRARGRRTPRRGAADGGAARERRLRRVGVPDLPVRAHDPAQAWLSRYSMCKSCHRRTLETQSRTLIPATTMSAGQQQITERCRNCAWTRTYMRTIPRIVQSSGGSGGSSGGGGGGGSSFGGGSAGGGGAGGRY